MHTDHDSVCAVRYNRRIVVGIQEWKLIKKRYRPLMAHEMLQAEKKAFARHDVHEGQALVVYCAGAFLENMFTVRAVQYNRTTCTAQYNRSTVQHSTDFLAMVTCCRAYNTILLDLILVHPLVLMSWHSCWFWSWPVVILVMVL